jgi:fumarate reductase subunit D
MTRHPKRGQPAVFWALLAFNIIMYALIIPMRVL